ncbi:MAG TPA: hypothetical protein VLS89_06870 [Candidatus Nanopelagicales bacterium]|nr:hypothetical protein [Candidatus Nanopelagicales bacterium]
MPLPLRSFALLPIAAALGVLVGACDEDPITFGKPPVVEPEGTPPDARNYCAVVGACELFPDFGFGECINELVRSQIETSPFGGDVGKQQRYDCVEAAGGDCELAKECIGRVAVTEPRCADSSAGEPWPGQPRSFCDGDRIIACNVMGTQAQNYGCADDFAQQRFGGPYCVENAEASALCGWKACQGSLEEGFPPPRCDENTLVYCTNGVEQRQNCSVFGGSCDAGQGRCVETCTPSGYVCKGTVLVQQCTDGSELSRYDCATREGWTCKAPESAASFGCAPPHDECAWGTYVAECVDGVKIQFCDDGQVSLFDCRDVGASGCGPTPAGVNCKL